MATFNVELEVDTPSKTKHIHNPSSVRYEKKKIHSIELSDKNHSIVLFISNTSKLFFFFNQNM